MVKKHLLMFLGLKECLVVPLLPPLTIPKLSPTASIASIIPYVAHHSREKETPQLGSKHFVSIVECSSIHCGSIRMVTCSYQVVMALV
jgi:hypothetical protein